MSAIVLKPGAVPLPIGGRIYRGAPATLDPACRRRCWPPADLVAASLRKGEPVYGINTGFGKLATVRSTPAISRRCSATSCCRMRPAWGSRPRRDRAADDGAEACESGTGRLRRTVETLELLEAMLDARCAPGRAVAGVCRRVR